MCLSDETIDNCDQRQVFGLSSHKVKFARENELCVCMVGPFCFVFILGTWQNFRMFYVKCPFWKTTCCNTLVSIVLKTVSTKEWKRTTNCTHVIFANVAPFRIDWTMQIYFCVASKHQTKLCVIHIPYWHCWRKHLSSWKRFNANVWGIILYHWTSNKRDTSIVLCTRTFVKRHQHKMFCTKVQWKKSTFLHLYCIKIFLKLTRREKAIDVSLYFESCRTGNEKECQAVTIPSTQNE